MHNLAHADFIKPFPGRLGEVFLAKGLSSWPMFQNFVMSYLMSILHFPVLDHIFLIFHPLFGHIT